MAFGDFFEAGNQDELDAYKKAANKPIKLPKGSGVAGFDPLQTQGQEMLLDTVPQQGQVAQNAFGANNFLLNDAINLDSNPHLQRAIDYAIDPAMNRFLEQIAPAIRMGAEGAGQFGGSTQGKLQNQEARDLTRNILGTTSSMASEGYNQGLRAMMYGVGAAPGVQSTLEAPALATSGVGDVRQGLNQAKLSDFRNQKIMKQMLPMMQAQQGMAMTPRESSPFEYTLAGAAAAAPFFASDRRLKRNISKLGTLPNGAGWYRFQYKWDDTVYEGFMADDVRRDAVYRAPNGYDYVNYELAAL